MPCHREPFQFAMQYVSNHTASHFAEKTRFFRALLAGWRCAAASHIASFQRQHALKGCGCIAALLLCSCAAAPQCSPLRYDNGDDYVREGLYRIVNRQGKVGYADAQGRVIIAPRFAFGFPFEQGRARVTDSGREVSVPGSGGEYRRWESDSWYYIDRSGNRLNDAVEDSEK